MDGSRRGAGQRATAPTLPAAWRSALEPETRRPYFRDLQAFVASERARHDVYPGAGSVYRALELTPLAAVRVVILGQDPYHGPGQAHGLAFSVPAGVAPPPSLRNVFRELADDLGVPIPRSGCLEPWAHRGVLLLNTVLTVRAGQAGSHAGRGWERFTDRVIAAVSARPEPVAFLLWGNPARAKRKLVDRTRHPVVESAHPSPLSAHRGFLGSRPFSRANALLLAAGHEPVDWSLGPGGLAPT